MSLSRLELDGLGSPVDIAARIHQLQPDLPLDFSIEQICSTLDIIAIGEVSTNGFEAALVMDPNKAMGSILLAADRRPERRRFSIGHELGHFLIPTHLPRPGEPFEWGRKLTLGLRRATPIHLETHSRSQHARDLASVFHSFLNRGSCNGMLADRLADPFERRGDCASAEHLRPGF